MPRLNSPATKKASEEIPRQIKKIMDLILENL
jgi:hypothetical protein